MTSLANEIYRVVPPSAPHIHAAGGDHIMSKQKYAAVYHYGNTTCCIVEPKGVTRAKAERIIDDMCNAAWPIIEKMAARGEKV